VLRRAPLPAVLALSLGAIACRGRPGPPPERFVPGAVRAVLVVPETGRAARELAALHATLAGFPGAADLAGARTALAAQLGFDPLDPAGLADAGIDPARGAALAWLDRSGAPSGTAALLVLPVGDGPKLERLLARLARERLGAEVRAAEHHGGGDAIVFRRAAGQPAALAYLVTGRNALVASGPASPALVAEAAALPEAGALSAAAGWIAARTALGDRAALAFLPAGSPLLAGRWQVRDGLGLGVSAGAGRLGAAVAVLLGPREPSFRALAAGGAAARVLARLDPRAPLALRWDGDFAALGAKLVPMLPADDRRRLEARGLDPLEPFGLLAPGAAAVLSLAPDLELASLTPEAVRADPLRLVRVEAVAEVKDPERALALSRKLAPPPRRGRGAPAPADGTFRIATPRGEIAWRLDGTRLALAGGPAGSLDTLLARLGGEGPGWTASAPGPAGAGALAGGLGSAVLDPQRLVASVRALPDEAFGTGPSGFVVRSVVDRFAEPASRLASVSLRAELAPGALVLALEAEAQAGEGAR